MLRLLWEIMEIELNPAPTQVIALVSERLRHTIIRGFAEVVREMGLAPALITTEAMGAKLSPDDTAMFAMVGIPQDLHRAEAVTECVRQLVGDRLRALISWDDSTMVSVAMAAELLGVARMPAAGIVRCRNKYAMRRALREARLPGPTFALMTDERDAARIAGVVGFPAIIKPVNGTGSCLVREVQKPRELVNAYRTAVASADRAEGMLAQPVADPDGRPLDASRQFLVESKLRGTEYDAEIVVRDREVQVSLTLQVLVDERNFFGFGYAYPPMDLKTEREQLVIEAIESAVRAIGIDNTNANVTVIDDEVAGPTIVEINAGRFGGQMISRIVFDLTGVDARMQHLAVAIGAEPPTPRQPPPGVSYAALSIFAERPGEVVAIHGLDAVRAHPQVAFVAPHVEPGEIVREHGATYAVNAMVRGFRNRQELLELHRELAQVVRVETRSHPAHH